MSHRQASRQSARGARSFVATVLLALQPVISALTLLPQPAHADVATNDIVFERAGGPGTTNYNQIYQRSSDGTLTDLSKDGKGAFEPDVSKDGSRIAYVATVPFPYNSAYAPCNGSDPDDYVLEVMNSDGSGKTQLTSHDCPVSGGNSTGQDLSPHWSPDGQKLAYTQQINGSSFLHVRDVAGVSPDIHIPTDLNDPTYGNEYDLTWSPDGTKIAYDAVDPATGGWQLYIVNADGTNEHPLNASPTIYTDFKPVWSPDGSRLYFLSSEGGSDSSLWYYSISNGVFTRATSAVQIGFTGFSSFFFNDYSVSEDGSQLTFAAPGTSTPCAEVFTLSKDGGTPVQKTTTTSTDGTPAGCVATNISPAFVADAWPTASTKNLVALGDSIAAGEGINYGWSWDSTNQRWVQNGPANPSWQDTTNATGANYQQCHQSGKSYADQFRLYGDNYHVYNMACTGATALQQLDSNSNPTVHGGVLDQELFGDRYSDGSVTPYPNHDDFYDPVIADSSKNVPQQLGRNCSGCASPNPYFDGLDSSHHSGHTPDVVTISLGANDLDFTHWISKCYGLIPPGACGGSADDSTASDELSNENTNLGHTLNELNRRAADVYHKKLRVLVTNYYNPFPAGSTTCVDTNSGLIGITSSEKAWILDKLSQLNANIGAQVTSAQINDPSLDVSLVDLSGNYGGTDIMAGHKWCSSDPYAYGISIDYPTASQQTGGINPAPFHPTPEGQHAIYQAVKAVLGGTAGALNPTADTYVNSSSPTSNYGGYSNLWAQSQTTRALLRFNTANTIPAGNVVRGATLKLYVNHNDVTTTGTGFEVHPEDDSWTETGVTWNNQSAWSSTVYAGPSPTDSAPSAGTWATIYLPASAINSGGDTNLGVRYTASGSNAQFASHEDSSHKPSLTIDYAPADPGIGMVSPSADTYANSNQTGTNYGTATPLASSPNTKRALLRFNTSGVIPSGKTLNGVTLRIYVTGMDTVGAGFEVHPETDTWTESGTTWANQPTWDSTVLATSGAPTAGSWLTITLPTSAVNASGNTSLGLRYTVSGSNAYFSSREFVPQTPQLILTWQ